MAADLQQRGESRPGIARRPFWFVLVIVFLMLCQLGFCWAGRERSLHGSVDLRAFYTAGHIVASGQGSQLYDYEYQKQLQSQIVSGDGRVLPFLYPAYTALLFVPLSLVSYQSAFLVFWIVNAALLCLTALLLRPHLRFMAETPAWQVVTMFFGIFPVSIALMQGQVSFLLLLIYSGCFLALKRERHHLAGILLACALIKFQIALPVAFLFFCWRQWRVLAGFAAGAAVLLALSVLVAGPHGCIQYFSGLAAMTGKTMMDADAAHQRFGMFPIDMPNLHGLFFFLSKGRWYGQVLSLIASVAVIAWTARQRASIALALPAALLVSYHMQPYDLTLLLLPMTVACGLVFSEESEAIGLHREGAPSYASQSRNVLSRRRWAVLVSILAITVPIAPLVLVHGVCCWMVASVAAALWANRSPATSEALKSNASDSEFSLSPDRRSVAAAN